MPLQFPNPSHRRVIHILARGFPSQVVLCPPPHLDFSYSPHTLDCFSLVMQIFFFFARRLVPVFPLLLSRESQRHPDLCGQSTEWQAPCAAGLTDHNVLKPNTNGLPSTWRNNSAIGLWSTSPLDQTICNWDFSLSSATARMLDFKLCSFLCGPSTAG